MGNLQKKRFFPKIAKAAWLAVVPGPAVQKMPLFTKEEMAWIDETNPDSESLERIWQGRVEDWKRPIIPLLYIEEKRRLRELPPPDSKTVEARENFFRFVNERYRKQ